MKSLRRLFSQQLKGYVAKPVAVDHHMNTGGGIGDAMGRLIGHGFTVKSIIDLGASDGRWTRMVFNSFPDAYVLGVEPLSERREALASMARDFRNFHFEICAAGSVDGGSAALHVTTALDGSYIGHEGVGSRAVPIRTVDSLVAQYELEGPFLLKFDTHGYEREILSGVLRTLPNVEIIVMEMLNFGGIRFPDLLLHLDALGYRPLDVADIIRTPTSKILWQFDFVLVKKDHPLLVGASYT